MLRSYLKILTVPVLLLTGTVLYGQSDVATIRIYFNSAPTSYSVNKAPLKYNKDFAYSFTLDDGKEDAYSVAYTLYKGGLMNGNGGTYPGLFYTDGCGNKIPFKSGLAMNSFTSSGFPHEGNPESITWAQVTELHNTGGWDVFNHSFSHARGIGTDYNFQVTENTSYIKSKTGIDLTHFVVPSGDTNYIQPAFNHGMKAVYNQNYFPGSNGFKIDGNLNLTNFKLFRQFMDDDHYNTSNITQKINQIAALSTGGNHYWYSEFSHRIGFNQTTGGGLAFPTFEYYMKYLESAYGENGTDRIWMAPLQEVYEYLSVRQNTILSSSLSGNVLEVKINFSNVPPDLRRYALSLIVDSDMDFNNIQVDNVSYSRFNGTGTKKLINLEWDSFATVAGVYSHENLEQCLLNHSTIYPNPVKDNKVVIQLQEKHDDEISLILYDLLGNELYSTKQRTGLGQKQLYLDLENLNLPAGLYCIKIISYKQGCSVSKMLVKY